VSELLTSLWVVLETLLIALHPTTLTTLQQTLMHKMTLTMMSWMRFRCR
jgi:hypothetical protein